MNMNATQRAALLSASVAIVIVALALVRMRPYAGAERALSTTALATEDAEVDADPSPVLATPRSRVTSAVEESTAAPETEAQPERRVVAASWMAARNAAHVVTPEQRLVELLSYREQFAAMTDESFLRYQTMATLAAVATATHLDELGQSSTHSVLPNERQWEFATGGAHYLFERGKYPAYDAARGAFEEAIRVATAEENSVGFVFATVPPIAEETIARVDEFVAEAILLLTRTE